jgi:hypothetical protein
MTVKGTNRAAVSTVEKPRVIHISPRASGLRRS